MNTLTARQIASDGLTNSMTSARKAKHAYKNGITNKLSERELKILKNRWLELATVRKMYLRELCDAITKEYE